LGWEQNWEESGWGIKLLDWTRHLVNPGKKSEEADEGGDGTKKVLENKKGAGRKTRLFYFKGKW